MQFGIAGYKYNATLVNQMTAPFPVFFARKMWTGLLMLSNVMDVTTGYTKIMYKNEQ